MGGISATGGTGCRERAIGIAARIATSGRIGAGLRALSDRCAVARDGASRPVFPYIRKRGTPCYQILIYHRVHDDQGSIFGGIAPRLFRRQMEVLAESFRVLPLEELVERAERNELPPGSMAITFDDGYHDNYEAAFPILRQFGLPATIFLATGPMDSGLFLRHDRLIGAFETASVPSVAVGGTSYPLATLSDRGAALNAYRRHLRTRRIDEWDGLVEEIEARLGGDPGSCRERFRKVDWPQVVEMARGGITFGAHTVTHPILTFLPLEDAVAEIQDSRRSIEGRLGARVRLFAYPNGGRNDFDDKIKGALRELGFLCALTNVRGANSKGTDPFELRREAIGDDDPRVSVLKLCWYKIAGG